MTIGLILCAVVMVAGVLCSRLSSKLGMPVLLAFIGLGMLFGSDGLFHIAFDDFAFAEQICSIALIFIMFYGGFGTKWNIARPIAGKAILLSTLGVVLTAGLTGLFCHFVLRIELLESLLIGAVLGSTDAASVFSILRAKRLSLKFHTDSMLELESGSNDPCAYMLTVLVLSIMQGTASWSGIAWMLFAQVFFGLTLGALIAWLASWALRQLPFEGSGLLAVFVMAIALLAYALPACIGGNGYIATYIVGIVLGNAQIVYKRELVHFFDGITSLMEIVLFFLLGLLAFPTQLPRVLLPALAIALFLTFVARPIAVCGLLAPLRAKWQQLVLVSWAGLRGAASIVFAIMATVSPAYMRHDVFHIVFCIVLMSIAIQGALLPRVSRKLRMINEQGDVLRTFNDYSEEVDVQLIEIRVEQTHAWIGKTISALDLPPGLLLVLIQRGEQSIVPHGGQKIQPGDVLAFGAQTYQQAHRIRLREVHVEEEHLWSGRRVAELSLPRQTLILWIRRREETLIPQGDTQIVSGDVVVVQERPGRAG